MAEIAQPETAEQIAKRVVREMNAELDGIGDGTLTMLETFERVATLTCAAIDKAIRAEREACAQTAKETTDAEIQEALFLDGSSPQDVIERRIRARGSK